MPGDKTAAVIAQGALDGNPIAIVMLAVIALALVYLCLDKISFRISKKKQGVPLHVVQTENTAGMTKELRRLIDIQERTNTLLADLTSGVHGMNELHARCQQSCRRADEELYERMQELLTRQRDTNDGLRAVQHDVRKLVTNGRAG